MQEVCKQFHPINSTCKYRGLVVDLSMDLYMIREVCFAWSSEVYGFSDHCSAERMGGLKDLALINKQFAIENGPVEIVDLPSYKMVIFHM